MYEVFLERRAERDLKRLAAKEFQRIIREIKALADNPRPSGCRKIAGSESDWRIRVGDYRVIYDASGRRAPGTPRVPGDPRTRSLSAETDQRAFSEQLSAKSPRVAEECD